MPGSVCGRRSVGSALAPARRWLGLRELGEPEIENLHAAVAGDEDVLRLQIAVDDPLLVRGGETVRDLDGVLDGLAHRQRRQLVERRSRSVSPSSSSETMYGAPSCVPMSWTARMFG